MTQAHRLAYARAPSLGFQKMAAKPVFTEDQHEVIHIAAQRVYRKHFKDQSKAPQVKMALALGISQQSVSKLLSGLYRPSLKVATELAILDGKESLEDLVGEYATVASSYGPSSPPSPSSGHFPNLDVCLAFNVGSKTWSPWTVAAARAGFFGPKDFPAPDWQGRLDNLEKVLERARKHGPLSIVT